MTSLRKALWDSVPRMYCDAGMWISSLMYGRMVRVIEAWEGNGNGTTGGTSLEVGRVGDGEDGGAPVKPSKWDIGGERGGKIGGVECVGATV
jgi:hypothetical protein